MNIWTEGVCHMCGNHIAPGDSRWVDAETEKMYCTTPDSINPAPVGSCYQWAKREWMRRHYRDVEKLMHLYGFRYHTDG